MKKVNVNQMCVKNLLNMFSDMLCEIIHLIIGDVLISVHYFRRDIIFSKPVSYWLWLILIVFYILSTFNHQIAGCAYSSIL